MFVFWARWGTVIDVVAAAFFVSETNSNKLEEIEVHFKGTGAALVVRGAGAS
jgi:hypothetical protein